MKKLHTLKEAKALLKMANQIGDALDNAPYINPNSGVTVREIFMKKKKKKPVIKMGATPLYTPEVIGGIAFDLDEWSMKPESLFLEEFLGESEYNLSSGDMSELSSKSEVFKATLRKVKSRLVARLKTKACTKVFDGSFVSKILPLVDLEYRKWRQEELRIADENAAKAFDLMISPKRVKKEKVDAE